MKIQFNKVQGGWVLQSRCRFLDENCNILQHGTAKGTSPERFATVLKKIRRLYAKFV